MADMHSAIESCANKDHHTNLEEHFVCMETFLGDHADKHGKEMKLHALRWLICNLRLNRVPIKNIT